MNSEDEEIILFNALKHHLRYSLHLIRSAKSPADMASFSQAVLTVGHSTLDLYTGPTHVSDIKQHILSSLMASGHCSVTGFETWVNSQGTTYKLIDLPDTSNWTLRYSKNTAAYIHIHPSRYSKHTVRVHAGPFKTALSVVAYCFFHQKEPNALSLEIINEIRQQQLGMSPVRAIDPAQGAGKLIQELWGGLMYA